MVNTPEDAVKIAPVKTPAVVEDSAVAKDLDGVGATDAPPHEMSPKAVALSQVLARLLSDEGDLLIRICLQFHVFI